MKKVTFEYSVKSFNKEHEYVTVEVYSAQFKNPKETYPLYNIGLQDVLNKDQLDSFILDRCKTIAEQTILKENEERLNDIEQFVSAIQNKQFKKTLNVNSFQQPIDNLPESSFEIIV